MKQQLTMTIDCKPWTLALIGAGLISLPAVASAEEQLHPVVTALESTTLSGYVDTSAHWNFGTGNENLPPYTANGASGGTKADGFNLDIVALTLSHPPGEGEWAAGYNATLLFGPDAYAYNNTFGTTPSDFSLKDVYVELKAPIGNGLDFKLGTFTEVLGYELFETGANPNYTRSYGYAIEPTALTGMLVTYQFSPVVSANAGIANTWNAGINARAFPDRAESFKTYIGSITLTAPESMGFLAGSTLLGGIINGYDTVRGATTTSWYIGGTLKTPVKGVSVGLAYDYVNLADNTVGAVTYSSGYRNAAGAYLLYEATEKLSLNTRAEYFSQSGYLATGGMPQKAFELTETLQYALWKNVLTRAEFRWDHDLNSSEAFSSGVDNAFLLAANIVYKF